MSDNQVIKYTDLAELDEAMKKMDVLNQLLMKPARQEWIKEHPILKKDNGDKLQYLPIDKVRLLMRMIFQRTRREVKEIKQVANSIVATVRVHYFNPMLKEWDWQDGVGAVQIQLKKGAAAFDLTQINSGAIQMGAPAAVSYAYKNACEEIGNIFGASIQKDYVEFKGMYAAAMDLSETNPQPQSSPVTETITTNF